MARAQIVHNEKHYRYHKMWRRALDSLVVVGAVVAIGTIGFHFIEGYSYVNSFYFVSMLATAEGPAITPATAIGKIFASAIAFVSVGSVIFALAFIFGPFITKIANMGERKIEKEEKTISSEITGRHNSKKI